MNRKSSLRKSSEASPPHLLWSLARLGEVESRVLVKLLIKLNKYVIEKSGKPEIFSKHKSSPRDPSSRFSGWEEGSHNSQQRTACVNQGGHNIM